MRQLIVFLAAVWILLVAVFAAEPLSRESAKEFLERLRAAKAKFENSSSKGNAIAKGMGEGVAGTEDTLNRATVFIGDSHSKGSGFFTKLWGEPVILTSAQVIALMQNPGLMNINSESFKVRAIVVHKNLDLAILEPEPGSVPKDMPFLKVDPKLILKDIGSTTEEYCDINGNRKLGKREGKLLGFEKDKIEIEYTVDPGKNDPPILAANSGGPILNKEGNVIGMTAYFREPSMREIFSGTRLFHLTETGKVEGEGAEEQAEKWEEKRKTGEIRFDNWRDGWSYYIPIYKTIYKYRYKVPRIEPIDLEGFELFDKASQEKDLAFYEKYEKIVRQCVNEVRDPHYNWTVYWPWNQQKPITDLSNISNYLYCYEHFHKMDWTTYFNYRASLSTLQHHLNFQQGVFAELSCLVHVNLLRLQETEISSAERIVKQLNKDRKGYFICPQCGGAKVIHISKLTGTITRDCPYCERAGRFTVPSMVRGGFHRCVHSRSRSGKSSNFVWECR